MQPLKRFSTDDNVPMQTHVWIDARQRFNGCRLSERSIRSIIPASCVLDTLNL